MGKGIRYGGRVTGTPNRATAEIRALASVHGPDAIAELAKLAGIAKDDNGNPLAGAAQTDQARIGALGMLLDRGYGRSPLSAPVAIDLPDTSTPQGIIKAMAAIVAAVAGGSISPAGAKDLADLIDVQRRAIETNHLEERVRAIEVRAGIVPHTLAHHGGN
jgi:hypothetical protein